MRLAALLSMGGVLFLLAVLIIGIFLLTRNYRKKCEVKELDEMEGHDFEYYCADLLKKRGFVDVTVTKGSGDYGVDVLAEKDGVTYGIQCKARRGA